VKAMRKAILITLLLLLAVSSVAAGPSRGFSYVFSRDGHSIMSGNVDLRHVLAQKDRWDAPFLWARIDGREYLTQDSTVIAEARAAFREVEVLHVNYERVHHKMRPLEERESMLEERIDRIRDRDEEDDEDVDRSKLAELERELEIVARQLRALEQEEERIDEREEALTAVAEKKLRGIIDRAIDRGVARRVD
jgi:hypothetical protein